MTFSMAIEAAKKANALPGRLERKRPVCELAKAISYKSPTGAVVNAEHDAIGNQALAFVGTSGVQMGWLAPRQICWRTTGRSWRLIWSILRGRR